MRYSSLTDHQKMIARAAKRCDRAATRFQAIACDRRDHGDTGAPFQDALTVYRDYFAASRLLLGLLPAGVREAALW